MSSCPHQTAHYLPWNLLLTLLLLVELSHLLALEVVVAVEAGQRAAAEDDAVQSPFCCAQVGPSWED